MELKHKWRFAIGTTSRVPGSDLHYLIADFDNVRLLKPTTIPYKPNSNNEYKTISEATPHGWHLYTNLIMNFDNLVRTLKEIEADPAWIEIGRLRGYYFLAHKSELHFSWPVEHMVIHHDKEKT